MENNIYIFGEIGWDVDAKYVSEMIQGINGDDIKVNIHSPGGSVSEGFAIYDILTQSGKNITTEITGLCASIATIIALAGKVRKISPNSEFMIHNPWMSKRDGDAEEYKKAAERLEKIENRIINFYKEKTGAEENQIKALMKAETFLSPEQALEMGFVTEILEPVKAMAYEGVNNDNRKEGNIMNDIRNEIRKGFSNMMAYIKPVKEEIQNWEFALENGETIISNNPANQNGPSIGDYVKLKDEGNLEDGEYKIAATMQTIKVESGQITEILENEVANSDNLSEVVNGMELIAKATGERFENLIKNSNEKFETIEKLLKDSFAKMEAESKALKEANEALKEELTTVKASISSGYTPPMTTEIQATTQKKYYNATEKEIDKIKNRNNN